MSQTGRFRILMYSAPLVLLVASLSASIPAAIPPANRVSGTYEILFCRRSCSLHDSSKGNVKGLLVLVEDSIPRSRLSPADLRNYDRMIGVDSPNEPPNACFVLTKSSPEGTLAGALPVGFSRWSHGIRDTIKLNLYRSPDSGYSISIAITEGAGRGIGIYWAAVSPSEDEVRDSVVVYRTGDANPTRCLRAARER
jgi:hypothetical protein